MDKKEYRQPFLCSDLCGECIHLFLNNGENGYGCRAFPDGIPAEVCHGHNHLTILPGQEGEFVFHKASYEELSPFAKYLYNKKHIRN